MKIGSLSLLYLASATVVSAGAQVSRDGSCGGKNRYTCIGSSMFLLNLVQIYLTNVSRRWKLLLAMGLVRIFRCLLRYRMSIQLWYLQIRKPRFADPVRSPGDATSDRIEDFERWALREWVHMLGF